MKYAVLDIETSPLPLDEIGHLLPERPEAEEVTQEEIDAQALKLASKYKKKETIDSHLEQWLADETAKRNPSDEEWEAEIAKFMGDAALDPARSKIAAVGIKIEGEDAELYIGEDGISEAGMLGAACAVINDSSLVVGHCVKSFDLPYLFRRMAIIGGDTKVFPDIYTLHRRTFDTCEQWLYGDRRGKWPKLDYLCTVFGLPTKPNGMTGKDFAGASLAEKAAYLQHDVTVTEQVALRLGLRSSLDFQSAQSVQIEDSDDVWEDVFEAA